MWNTFADCRNNIEFAISVLKGSAISVWLNKAKNEYKMLFFELQAFLIVRVSN